MAPNGGSNETKKYWKQEKKKLREKHKTLRTKAVDQWVSSKSKNELEQCIGSMTSEIEKLKDEEASHARIFGLEHKMKSLTAGYKRAQVDITERELKEFTRVKASMREQTDLLEDVILHNRKKLQSDATRLKGGINDIQYFKKRDNHSNRITMKPCSPPLKNESTHNGLSGRAKGLTNVDLYQKFSIYYHPVTNPGGIPPVGAVQMYKYPDGSKHVEPPDLSSSSCSSSDSDTMDPSRVIKQEERNYTSLSHIVDGARFNRNHFERTASSSNHRRFPPHAIHTNKTRTHSIDKMPSQPIVRSAIKVSVDEIPRESNETNTRPPFIQQSVISAPAHINITATKLLIPGTESHRTQDHPLDDKNGNENKHFSQTGVVSVTSFKRRRNKLYDG